MKKLSAIFFIGIVIILSTLICLFGLIACNNESGEPTSPTTEPHHTNNTETDECHHVYGEWLIVEVPTCIETGLKTKECKVCKNKTSEIVPACGHMEAIDSAKSASCTSSGLTEGKHCSVCNEVIVAQTVVPATGHAEVIDAYAAPTCTDAGLTEGKHCSVCKEVLVKQTVIPAGHTEVIDPYVAPSCTAIGLTEGKHCSVCKKILVEQTELSALGHNEVVDAYVEPTCSTVGFTQGSHCSLCSEIFVEQKEIPALEHRSVTDIYVAPTCTDTGLTEGIHCSVCNEVLIKQDVIPALGHTEVIDEYVAPSCTDIGLTEGKHCSVCNVVFEYQTVIEATGHTEVVDAYVAPTCASKGLTEGIHCSVCNEVLKAQTTISKSNDHRYGIWRLTTAPSDTESGKETSTCIICNQKQSRDVTWNTVDWSFLNVYNSRYGYEYLGTLDDGENLQALYNEIDKFVRKFHFDTSINAASNCEIATINYKDLGLISSRVAAVLKVYGYDNPLYYWLSDTNNGLGYNLILCTEPEYAYGSVRAQYNALIFDVIDKYTSLVKDKTSAYEIALVYRDAIVGAIDYTDDENKDAVWAHNILGVFEKGSGVCEAYAKTFQLLLNVSGVNNIYIVGQSGRTGHVWNLVQMDDGNWYWCDLTFDDGSDSYDYFCVGNTSAFTSNHTCGTTSFYSKHYLYKLPDVATKNYKP